MKKFLVIPLLSSSLALAQVEKKLSLFTGIDLGRVESGYDFQKDYEAAGMALNRTYVDVNFTDQLSEKFLISVGVGGIFWKAFEGRGGTGDDKVIKFGPGISQAFFRWNPNPALGFTFGYFPYKYNMAAKNLGEYLFRTEAYPTILYTGGWSWMNDVAYHTVGGMLTWKTAEEKFKLDAGFFGEYFNSPIYDITPAAIATFKPINGLTFGGAASYHRLISPTKDTKKVIGKEHIYYNNFYLPEVWARNRYKVNIEGYAGTASWDVNFNNGGAPNVDSLKNAIFTADQAALASKGITTAAAIPLKLDENNSWDYRAAGRVTKLHDDISALSTKEVGSSGTYFTDPQNAAGVDTQQVVFDLAAPKVLAFFQIDFNGLFGWDKSTVGAFDFYGEIAQLGFKNYPVYYTDMAQRRPLMLGLSIPTFFLDHLSVEWEYLKNPTIMSIRSTFDKLDIRPDEDYRERQFAGDDTKWSVHAAKSINKFMTIYLQVANDHMRLKDGFARPEFIPITNETDHWYWLTRIQWAI